MLKEKEELEERINASIVNLSGDVAKFESSVEERLKSVENSLSRKMESIYKTLTSVFENINDLQAKLNTDRSHRDIREREHKEHKEHKEHREHKEQREQKKEGKEKVPDLSFTQRPAKERQIPVTDRDSESGGRRRSFLGFLKY